MVWVWMGGLFIFIVLLGNRFIVIELFSIVRLVVIIK